MSAGECWTAFHIPTRQEHYSFGAEPAVVFEGTLEERFEALRARNMYM